MTNLLLSAVYVVISIMYDSVRLRGKNARFAVDADMENISVRWIARPSQKRNVTVLNTEYSAGSFSPVACFRADYDIQRKYETVSIKGISKRLKIDIVSDITLFSKKTYRLFRKLPTKPSKKTANNASGGVAKLVDELQCELFLNRTNCKGICYLTGLPKRGLYGLDMFKNIHKQCVVFLSLGTPILAKKTGERFVQ